MAEPTDTLVRLKLDVTTLETWVEAGWLVRRGEAPYAAPDIARACLIRDLRETMGVNDEGVGVALRLIDQIHGLRRALRVVATAMRDLPEPVREQVLDVLREGQGEGEPEA